MARVVQTKGYYRTMSLSRQNILMNGVPATAATDGPGTTEELFADRRCHVRIVATSAEFDALEADWNEMVQASGTTVFQTYEWLRTWWKHRARPQDRLHILLFTLNNRLIGIAPLYQAEWRILGVRVLTHLQFIGQTLSDYVDMIIRPGHEQVVLNALARHLLGSRRQWDIFDIRDVSERSELARSLPVVFENHGLAVYTYQGSVCPSIALPASSEELLPGIGATAAYNYKRKLKKLQQHFTYSIEVYRRESDNIEEAIEMFSYIHGQRWKSQGYPSAFDDARFRQYHVEFARKLARRGWLRIHVLKVDGVPVAVNFGFNYNGRMYMYHSNAHGTDDVMKCSPGFLIRTVAMTEGIDEGMRTFDFLRGDEEYKYREWKAADSKNYLLRTSSPTPAGRVRFVLFLGAELASKAQGRLAREYYQYRRFTITGKRTGLDRARYAADRGTELALLAYNFVVRHAPLEAVRRLTIERPVRQDGTEGADV